MWSLKMSTLFVINVEPNVAHNFQWLLVEEKKTKGRAWPLQVNFIDLANNLL